MSHLRPRWCHFHELTLKRLNSYPNKSRLLSRFLNTLYNTLHIQRSSLSFKPSIKNQLNPKFSPSSLQDSAHQLHELLTETARAYRIELITRPNVLQQLSPQSMKQLIKCLNHFISDASDSGQAIEKQYTQTPSLTIQDVATCFPRPQPVANEEDNELSLTPVLTRVFSGLFSLLLFFINICIDLACTPSPPKNRIEPPSPLAAKWPPTPRPFKEPTEA